MYSKHTQSKVSKGSVQIKNSNSRLQIDRRLKIFRLLSQRYRNPEKAFWHMRFNLIAAVYNFELSLCVAQLVRIGLIIFCPVQIYCYFS